MASMLTPRSAMGGTSTRRGSQDGHGGHIDSVSRLDLEPHGVGVRGYRVVVTAGQTSTWGDYLFLQAHRTWVTSSIRLRRSRLPSKSSSSQRSPRESAERDYGRGS